MDFSFHKISIQDRKFSKFLSFPNLRPNLRPQDFKASVAEAEAEFSKSSAFGRPLPPTLVLGASSFQLELKNPYTAIYIDEL